MWGTPRPGQMAGRGGASAGVWCTRLGTRESTVLAGTPLTHHAQDGPGASRQRERVSSSLQQAYLGNRKSSEKLLGGGPIRLYNTSSCWARHARFRARAAAQVRPSADGCAHSSRE